MKHLLKDKYALISIAGGMPSDEELTEWECIFTQ